MEPREPYGPTLHAQLAADRERAFVRWLGALLTCRGLPDHARDFLVEKGWTQTLKTVDEARSYDVALHHKAAVAAGTMIDGTWAQPLSPVQLAAPFVAALQTQTLFAKAGCTKVPAHCGIPVDTSAPLAGFGWAGEAKPKPVSARALAMLVLLPAKAQVTVVITREVARFATASAEEFFRTRLVTEVTVGCDNAALDPAKAAVAGVSPGSLTNGLTPVTVGTGVAAAVGAVLAQLFAQRPLAVRPTLVLHPALCARLAGDGVHPNLTVNGGTAFGVPVVSTPGAGAAGVSWIVALDAAACAYADDGAEFDIAEHATIEMADTPTDPPVAATTFVSLWQNDLVGLRAERHLTWKAAPGAVAYAVAP